MNATFWEKLNHLLDTSNIVIDRPKGSAHPRISDIIYPLDYGYLDGTTGGDGDGIDLCVGSVDGEQRVVGALATVDTFKRDAEVKILVNCTDAEIQTIVQFYRDNQMGVYLMSV